MAKRIGKIETQAEDTPEGFDDSPSDPLEIKESDLTGTQAHENMERGIWEGNKSTSTKGYRVGKAYYDNLDRVLNSDGKTSGMDKLSEKWGECGPGENPAK